MLSFSSKNFNSNLINCALDVTARQPKKDFSRKISICNIVGRAGINREDFLGVIGNSVIDVSNS